MKQWEYRIIDSNTIKKPGLMKDFAVTDVQAYLNKIGETGWEIIDFQCKFKLKEIEWFHGLAKREQSAATQTPQPENSAEV